MHSISDNDLFQRLAFDNPWWEFTDETSVRFKNPTRRTFFPAFFSRLMKTGAGEALVIAGPLRAGKTVILRQMVASLIERGIKPRNVFYASLTTPSYTAADLGTLFEMFCRRYRHKPDAEIFVFFDEIQYVREWETMLLALAARRPNARFVAAVSAGAPAITSDTKTHDGKLTTFVLPPLTFLEFLRFRGSEAEIFDLPGDDDPEGVKRPAPGQGHVKMHKGAGRLLNDEFHRYVNFGGFLEGVLGSKTSGAPAPTFIRDGVADRVLHKDLAGMAGVNDAQELNRLFAILAFNTAREISMDDLAGVAGIAKNTLRKYLDYLEAAFLIRRLPRVDRDAKRFQRAISFKVYLTAPCLYSALFGPAAPEDQVFARLAETALISQWLGAPSLDHLAYASWKNGSIDLMALDPSSDRPDHVYEMDWGDAYGTPTNKPAGLVDFVERNNREAFPYILTRSIARPGQMRGINVTLAPLALYCYWLDRDPTLRSFHARRAAERDAKEKR
ncbi:MAG: AAA family ATPase [Rhodospirillales bacterium]